MVRNVIVALKTFERGRRILLSSENVFSKKLLAAYKPWRLPGEASMPWGIPGQASRPWEYLGQASRPWRLPGQASRPCGIPGQASRFWRFSSQASRLWRLSGDASLFLLSFWTSPRICFFTFCAFSTSIGTFRISFHYNSQV